jgi:cyanophycinase-like exopeptidase
MAVKLALIGGEEFADGFEDVHAQLADLAYRARQSRNSHPLKIVFLPTCAARDGSETVQYWCEQAQQRLGVLGAQVSALQIVDRTSANDNDYARQIAEADWVYIGGGYPHVGMQILSGTLALDALNQTRQRGALISGASAGAMLLGARSWVITPQMDRVVTALLDQGGNPEDVDIPIPPFLDCLAYIPGVLCWPHLNKFFSMRWVEQGMLPPGCTMLGVDEQTALVSENTHSWQVLGRGRAMTIDPDHQIRTCSSGQELIL